MRNKKTILSEIAEIELQLEIGMANGQILTNETEMLLEEELERLTTLLNGPKRVNNKKLNQDPDEK